MQVTQTIFHQKKQKKKIKPTLLDYLPHFPQVALQLTAILAAYFLLLQRAFVKLLQYFGLASLHSPEVLLAAGAAGAAEPPHKPQVFLHFCFMNAL